MMACLGTGQTVASPGSFQSIVQEARSEAVLYSLKAEKLLLANVQTLQITHDGCSVIRDLLRIFAPHFLMMRGEIHEHRDHE
jgi:hypothetical protein